MITQGEVFDARRTLRDSFLGYHLWALLRGDAFSADYYGKTTNELHRAVA